MPDIYGGTKENPAVGMRELRSAIPEHCWRRSDLLGGYYVLRDVALVILFGYIATIYIPLLSSPILQVAAWLFYGWLQGLVFTGLWVLGHECGHGAFSATPYVNETVGFIIHSFLFTPFFSWRASHRWHHNNANNLAKDHNHVPLREEEYLQGIGGQLLEASEDAPAYILLRVVLQQLFGWPMHLLLNTPAPPGSLNRKRTSWFLDTSHFLPGSAFFRPEEQGAVIFSNLGLAIVAAALYYAGQRTSSMYIIGLYVQPYLWVNHWIVAVTFLHHTDPKIPRYDRDGWTFIRGATSTVDRDFGFIDRFFFHNVIGFHVVHHLFPKIPFYNAPEATKAIKPLLGEMYHEAKDQSYLSGLHKNMAQCQYVVPDESRPVSDRAYWFKAGRMPGVFTSSYNTKKAGAKARQFSLW